MNEEAVKYVLSQYLSDILVEIIINEIKAAEGGEADDVDG